MVEWYWQGNWSTGRKTFYSGCGGLMDGYGAMVEWYWQGKTEVLGEKSVTVHFGYQKSLHGLMWDWTWISAVTCRWPTARVMARPYLSYIIYLQQFSPYPTVNALRLCYEH
jgi:hypothetical protein